MAESQAQCIVHISMSRLMQSHPEWEMGTQWNPESMNCRRPLPREFWRRIFENGCWTGYLSAVSL